MMEFLIHISSVIPHKALAVDAGPNLKPCALLLGPGSASLRSWARMTN